MKIILTGPTGFIGQEVLSQCLSHPSITSIVALSRRDLPVTSPNPNSKKLTVHRITDPDFASSFSTPTPELRSALSGADACIWTLGVTPSRASADWEAFRRVTVEYTRFAAEAFSGLCTKEESGAGKNKFRFVYFSGGMAERDQGRSLWLNGGYRKVRGEAENILLTHAQANADSFESYIMRPGMVLTKGGSVADFIRGLAPSVRVDVLAKAAVDVAVQGNGERLLENEVIKGWK